MSKKEVREMAKGLSKLHKGIGITKKEEREILKGIAKIWGKRSAGKRIRVELPDLPKFRPLAKDPQQAMNDDWKEWNSEYAQRKIDALCELAKKRNSDVGELAKVGDLLIDVVLPDMRGKKGVDYFPKFLLVSLELRKGKSQTVACQLAGIDPKTFRKLRDQHELDWRITETVTAELPEDAIRALANSPPEE